MPSAGDIGICKIQPQFREGSEIPQSELQKNQYRDDRGVRRGYSQQERWSLNCCGNDVVRIPLFLVPPDFSNWSPQSSDLIDRVPFTFVR